MDFLNMYTRTKDQSPNVLIHKKAFLTDIFHKNVIKKVAGSKPFFGKSVYVDMPSQANAFSQILESIENTKGEILNIGISSITKNSFLMSIRTCYKKSCAWYGVEFLVGIHPEMARFTSFNELMKDSLEVKDTEHEMQTDSIVGSILSCEKVSYLTTHPSEMTEYIWYKNSSSVYIGAKTTALARNPLECLPEQKPMYRFDIQNGMIVVAAA